MKHLTLTVFLVSLLTAGAHATKGVTDGQILLGQSCALKGPAGALGKGMKTGLNAWFERLNAAGGIAGRMVSLKSINDGYEPEKCAQATSTLIEKVDVFMMIGGVGTPTAKVAVPICEEKQVPFVAPFTGAEFLRNPY
ncbi:MAG: ABC transporter substrate-binding protein, partial [Pseudomonadota bacterium]